jgi:hypothetical protein
MAPKIRAGDCAMKKRQARQARRFGVLKDPEVREGERRGGGRRGKKRCISQEIGGAKRGDPGL